jgi:hypothetical protein
VKDKVPELKAPPEPAEVYEFIKRVRSLMGPSGSIDWDPLAVWAGSSIQKYLWSFWKGELKNKGFTWQEFLKLMKYRTDDAILWFYGKISWEEFVKRVIASIEGPLGRAITKR